MSDLRNTVVDGDYSGCSLEAKNGVASIRHGVGGKLWLTSETVYSLELSESESSVKGAAVGSYIGGMMFGAAGFAAGAAVGLQGESSMAQIVFADGRQCVAYVSGDVLDALRILARRISASLS